MTLTKTIFRKKCLQKMKKLPQYNKNYQMARLMSTLEKVIEKQQGKRILFYYPLDFEADIRKLLQKMRRKKDVYLPFMEGESFKMVPFRLPLTRKKFGVYEAGNSLRQIKNIDIMIVPSIGVDGNFQRIGFGKGMYDRFFAKLRKRPYIIFVQPQLCFTQEKICDDYDITCNLLVTPCATLEKRKY
jgi:5-formyltetrahydrofolate cyclo-ligase